MATVTEERVQRSATSYTSGVRVTRPGPGDHATSSREDGGQLPALSRPSCRPEAGEHRVPRGGRDRSQGHASRDALLQKGALQAFKVGITHQRITQLAMQRTRAESVRRELRMSNAGTTVLVTATAILLGQDGGER